MDMFDSERYFQTIECVDLMSGERNVLIIFLGIKGKRYGRSTSSLMYIRMMTILRGWLEKFQKKNNHMERT